MLQRSPTSSDSGSSCSKDHPSRHLQGGTLHSLSTSFKLMFRLPMTTLLSPSRPYPWTCLFEKVYPCRGVQLHTYQSTFRTPGLQNREVPMKRIDSRPFTRRTLSMRQPKTGTPRQQGVGHLLAAPVFSEQDPDPSNVHH